MEAALERYVRYLEAERNVSPHTVANYRREIGQFLRFATSQGVRTWEAVQPPLLRQWLAQLHADGYVRASVARRVSELRTFFAYMKRQGLVEVNPVSAIAAPRLPQRLPRPLAAEEVVALLAAPETVTPQGQRDRAMLEFLYAGGLRISELLALNVASLDLEQGQVRVFGKGAKERIVLIGAPAREAVQAYLAEGRLHLVAARKGGRRAPTALFLNRFGERLSVSMFTRLVAGYARSAGIAHRVTPHMLRHSFATHLLDGGADLRAVQELMGHEQASTTQIYTQVSQTHLRRTVLNAHPRARLAPPTSVDLESGGPA
jgi:tyrosine recombinase XerC